MKKIILILFLFLLCYACYYIYNITEDHRLYVVSIGDNIPSINNIKNNNLVINTDFTNKDYDINELLDIIKYNKEITINDNPLSIHRLLNKADIVIISIGMNDIYYKLNTDSKEIYTYLNNIIHNYEEILIEISKYTYQKVYILGYYNITNKNTDIFTYVNYKLKKLTNKYHYTYIDLNKIFNNHPEYLLKKDQFYLNNKGIDKINKLIVENLKKT